MARRMIFLMAPMWLSASSLSTALDQLEEDEIRYELRVGSSFTDGCLAAGSV